MESVKPVERLEFDHWYANENGLSIFLMRFPVEIPFEHTEDGFVYPVVVRDSELNEVRFPFFKLNDSIHFVKSVVNQKDSFQDMITSYQDLIEKGIVKLPVREVFHDGSVNLTEQEMYKAITDCFGRNRHHQMEVTKELHEYGGKMDVFFTMIERYHYAGADREETTGLTESDLRTAFNDFLAPFFMELRDFKYIGFVRRPGMFTDGGPVFQGVKLYTRRKELEVKKEYQKGYLNPKKEERKE